MYNLVGRGFLPPQPGPMPIIGRAHWLTSPPLSWSAALMWEVSGHIPLGVLPEALAGSHAERSRSRAGRLPPCKARANNPTIAGRFFFGILAWRAMAAQLHSSPSINVT